MIVEYKQKTYYAVTNAADHMVKGSVQKIGLVANMINGVKVDQALLTLKFLKKRVAKSMYAVLKSAIANAEENFGVDSEKLYICRVNIGKSLNMKRLHVRGRGRASRINKPFSNVTIYVGERES
jgi:large subunit ribosomal protein L22